jgi:hypothetical protein
MDKSAGMAGAGMGGTRYRGQSTTAVIPDLNLAPQSRVRDIVGKQAAMTLLGQSLGIPIQALGDIANPKHISISHHLSHLCNSNDR